MAGLCVGQTTTDHKMSRRRHPPKKTEDDAYIRTLSDHLLGTKRSYFNATPLLGTGELFGAERGIFEDACVFGCTIFFCKSDIVCVGRKENILPMRTKARFCWEVGQDAEGIGSNRSLFPVLTFLSNVIWEEVRCILRKFPGETVSEKDYGGQLI